MSLITNCAVQLNLGRNNGCVRVVHHVFGGLLAKKIRQTTILLENQLNGLVDEFLDCRRFALSAVTGPTFCTKASERVYITTSSGKDANGGAQGAVGDRRAAICGANAAGAGGLYPSAECGRLVLYSIRHFSITICASFNE